jgi:hypothetical protein
VEEIQKMMNDLLEQRDPTKKQHIGPTPAERRAKKAQEDLERSLDSLL